MSATAVDALVALALADTAVIALVALALADTAVTALSAAAGSDVDGPAALAHPVTTANPTPAIQRIAFSPSRLRGREDRRSNWTFC